MFLKTEVKLFPGLLAYHSRQEHHGTYYILIGIEATAGNQPVENSFHSDENLNSGTLLRRKGKMSSVGS